jgi:hypothetical protein
MHQDDAAAAAAAEVTYVFGIVVYQQQPLAGGVLC